MKKWLATLLVALFVALSVPGVARATTMLPMYLDDLTAASQTVVYGKVMASRTEWDQTHNMIYTVYTVSPSEYLKGQLGATFELREPGGESGGLGIEVSGVPQFEVGQEEVLFVWTDPKGNNQVSAYEQGAVLIATDAAGTKVAARAVPLGSARALASSIAGQPGTSRNLPQLFDQIRSSVAKTTQAASVGRKTVGN